MSLNTAIVLGRYPVHEQIMRDPIGQGSPLPLDVLRIIFQNLKIDLPATALVSKKWKALADDKMLREMIRPVQAFGTKEWKEYIGVDAGEEPCLPRRAYGDLAKEDGLLTFIPKKVKVTKENGVVEEVLLDNLEAIGMLVNNPKKGNKTDYEKKSFDIVIEEKRKIEKPHWVWINKQIRGRNIRYVDQKKLIARDNKNAVGAHISGLIDTTVSAFMEFVRSGKCDFFWNAGNNSLRTYVRVNEKTDRVWPTILVFTRTGLYVTINIFDNVDGQMGVLSARKSF